MYEKVTSNLNFTEREKNTLEFWKENEIFKKSVESREGCPVYTFYDGPPTANGTPHIGHVETRAIKDLIPRYQTMKGNKCLRKAGWDTHGLPVELEVEKQLGLDGKDQIEQYGMDPFIQKCKESVWKYKGMWEEFSDAVGFWADMDNPYVTYHNEYIESVWWSLKKIWERDLLYKGYKIVPYCPRCGTPLSSHEVAQGYKDVKERSAIVKFKLKDEDAFILAWTTTPWTLPSNVALCVNANLDYVKVEKDGEIYYLAEGLCASVLGDDYKILETFKGKDLEHKEYQPLFDFLPTDNKAYYVTCGEFVTLGDGTGVVHIAPAFGEDDSVIGRNYDLPFVQNVDPKGEMTANTPWSGVFVKKADPLVLQNLEERGLLFSAPKFEHSYPHCWRCDTPLIYYARESWFIKMTAVKDDLVRNNKTINWVPETIGQKRFGDWLENVQDWGISRNRYWGTPLNIWECEDGHFHSVGSIAELKELSDNCPDDIELHRPYIDDVTIRCPQCGKEMRRVEEVIDCWYDSGAMPFAQWHYPFENKDIFEQNYPADFISEAVDQTRGWFYSLLAISTLIFDDACYKNVVVLGLVLDKDGQKMSKSKGNAVQPLETLAKHGADAVRWYFYEGSAPWLPKRFSDEAVNEGQRKFLSTIWNTYYFYVLYADIDGFDPTQYKLEPDKLPVMDKWVLSKLNSLVETVDNNLGSYRITESARALDDFVDSLSNWYVRRSRERFWAKDMTQDKINAYMTLYTALVTLAKLCAPMVPFVTEDIYRNLVTSFDTNAPISVHLCDYPVADSALIDAELELNMDAVLKIVALGRAARNNAEIKNRQPLAKMFVNSPSGLSQFYIEIIEDELNLKNVEFVSDMSRFGTYLFKPQLKTLGPKYGKQLGEIREALAALDGNAAKKSLDDSGGLVLSLKDGDITLGIDDLLIEPAKVEGFAAQSEGAYAIAIDTHLSEDLIEEGFVRELISKIQTMRKDAGFEVMDYIILTAEGNDKIAEILKRNFDTVKEDVLAKDILFDAPDSGAFVKDWSINGEDVTLSVKKV
jgi:isoleucyl-tRNA synthetase